MEMRSKAHGEGTVVRNSERFRDMDSTHGARRLDEKIGPLACLPRRLQKVVEPASELESVLCNTITDNDLPSANPL